MRACTMASVGEIAHHFGKWLKRRIEDRGMPIVEFAKKVGTDESSLHRWFGQRAPRIRGFKLGRLAAALEIERDELESELQRAAIEQSDEAGFDPNVEPYTEEAVPLIPEFDVAVAAGQWVEVDTLAEVCDPAQIDHGIFRIRIRGDSMQPMYKDGCLVEFKCLRFDRDAIEVGEDYYVQRADGMATFKTMAKIGEDELVLKARNKKKYPDPMPVERGLVVRMAKAVAIVQKLGKIA